MGEFLTTQLDYVYFVHGLGLVLLGAVATTISRSASNRLPWGWLAASSFGLGFVEWTRLAEIASGRSPALGLAVPALLLGSYLALFEFARRSQAVIRGAGPGPWLTWAVAAMPVSAVVVVGPAGLDTATRVLVAVPATLWTSFILAATVRRAAPGQGGGGALAWAAFCMAAYGITSGVVLPAGPFVPRGWPTTEAFVAGTGVPIQLLRAAAIGGAALGIWAYAISLDAQGRVVRKRWRFFWVATATLGLVLAGGWVVTEQLGRRHDQELAAEVQVDAAQVQDHLVMELASASDAARTAAGFISRFGLAPAVTGGGSARLDDVVDAVAGREVDQVASVLDASGTVVAASDRDRAASSVGKDLGHLPYFRDALAGVPGRFIGLGITSQEPGLYASEPIRDGAKVVGVAVVKHVLSVNSFGPLGIGTSFLVNSDGQVLLAGAEAWKGRPMWSLVRAEEAGPLPRPGPLLPGVLSGLAWVHVDGARHVAVRIPLPGLDWSIVAFKRETLRASSRLLGILIALLLCLVILAAFVILQRQLGTESRLAQKHREAEGRARELARRADTDALTGIANRQGFNDAMAREFARARRFRHPLAIVIVDLDHFKRVNDRYGHPVGDQVLVGAARMLATRVRESDFVARWGGEEFAVIASMTDAAGAARLAEKLRALMEVTHLGPVGALTASFGVAEMRPDDTVETMVRRADDVLYEAKSGGRNQVRCAESWVDMEVVAAAESQASLGNRDPGKRIYMDTGYGPIDVEHQELSEALDAFVPLVHAGDAAVVRPAMANLIAAVADHFAHEEALMRKRAYPSRARHEEAHMLFVGDAKRFQAELERNGVTPGFQQWAASRLPEWFRYHILAHDVALGKFLVGVADAGRPVDRKTEGARA